MTTKRTPAMQPCPHGYTRRSCGLCNTEPDYRPAPWWKYPRMREEHDQLLAEHGKLVNALRELLADFDAGLTPTAKHPARALLRELNLLRELGEEA